MPPARGIGPRGFSLPLGAGAGKRRERIKRGNGEDGENGGRAAAHETAGRQSGGTGEREDGDSDGIAVY